jgi:valyl-tRNA synthetase
MDKKYDHILAEQEAQRLWQQGKIYKAENNPGVPYTVDTPPPTASGTLHIGHVFSYTQADIIVRYKRMMGFSVVYPFGVDGNGRATEKYVEKKRGIRKNTMARSEFIRVCLEETELMGQAFKELWTRLGLSIDWDLFYSTISPRVQKISQESFIELYKKGYIYRKADPALYCPTCRTSVAQAELDDAQVASVFNDIVFKDAQGRDLIVGTTRPEMLPACVALLYNPSDSRYTYLRDTEVTVPVFGFKVPVIADEAVATDKGTGLVMCCTFGDKTDVAWYKKYKLPYKKIFDQAGKFLEHTGILAGLNIKDGRARIIEELKNAGLLRGQKPIVHTVNVDERCKHEIEYVVLSQWFVRILDFKKEFLELADTIEWYPVFMKARYIDWVKNLNWDWCISRQLFYGIPFPVWHCQDCGHTILADVKDLPIDPQERPYTQPCPQCHGTHIEPDTDIMDTWNTSSLTPYIVYDLVHGQARATVFDDKSLTAFLPMSMRPQAHDIIRTWAFYTMVKAWMHNRTTPWKSIVISGHVLSDAGGKISKSKGGADTTPDGLLKRYPADAVRFWTASGTLGQDIIFSENQIQIGQKLIVKLWNAFRFIHEHIQVCDVSAITYDLGAVNEWILFRSHETFTSYRNYLDKSEFSLALSTVEELFWRDFCDNYLEIIKDQLFNPHLYTQVQVRATKWTLHNVGLRVLQMYAPYLPHIAETLYQSIYRQTVGVPSVHQTRFSDIQQPRSCPEDRQCAESIIAIVAQVRKLKSDHQLSLKTTVNNLSVGVATEELGEQLRQYDQVIKGVTQALSVDYRVAHKLEPRIDGGNGTLHATVWVGGRA